MTRKIQILIFTFICLSLNGSAQLNSIVLGDTVGMMYTELSPDTLLVNSPGNTEYFIDIDNNGSNDFKLAYADSDGASHNYTYVGITPLGVNKVGYETTDTVSCGPGMMVSYYHMAQGFSIGNTIDSNITFLNSSLAILDEGYNPIVCSHNQLIQGGNYIAVCLTDIWAGTCSYGWIKLNNITNAMYGYFTVESYAIDASVLSIDQVEQSSFKVYPNPSNDLIHIDVLNDQQGLSIELFSLSGQKQDLDLNENHETISIAHLTEGVYILKLSSDEQVHTFRIIKD